MVQQKSDQGSVYSFGSGLELRCHKCGGELPLMHPHIMVERYDEDENVICEECYIKYYSDAK